MNAFQDTESSVLSEGEGKATTVWAMAINPSVAFTSIHKVQYILAREGAPYETVDVLPASGSGCKT